MSATAEQLATARAAPRLRDSRLTPQEVRFCKLYNEYGNASRAYREAGYPAQSHPYQGVAAWRLLRRDKIRQYIRRIQADTVVTAQTTAASIVRSLADQATADRTAIFGPNNELLPVAQWPTELRSIVAGFEVENITGPDGVVIGQRHKVRFERSTEAKRILAQWAGLIGQDAPADGAANALADLVRDAIRGTLTAPTPAVEQPAREVVALPAGEPSTGE